MKKIILSTLSILLLGLILTNISCEKLEIKRVTKLNTGEAKDIGYFKATIEGTIVDLAENTGEIGHCWDTLSEPDVNKTLKPWMAVQAKVQPYILKLPI